MSKFFRANYWSVGFQSHLYDWLSPESYFESMRRLVAAIPEGKSLRLLDAGCGSGLLLRFLTERLQEGMIYTGVDLLRTGVEQTLLRAQELGVTNQVSCFKSDLTAFTPMIGEKFDVVVGHFLLYTIMSNEKREEALAHLKSVMKTGGILILVNPSVDYNVNTIIDESIWLIRGRYGFLASLIKQFVIYPFTKSIGLRFIKKQLGAGEWKAYKREEFCQEIKRAGFVIQHIEQVYAGSAFLVTARLST
jgi:ubiquinone/menaquinone biosynthesis C-methylase UbiE